MSSRFKVQKVSESEGNEILNANTKDDTAPLNPGSSGPSTPDTSNTEDRENRSLLASGNLDGSIEEPPPYSEEKEGSRERLVSEPDPQKDGEPDQQQAMGDGSKESKSRFHVEFVDPKNGSASQSPPVSPNHDSVNNSVSHNTHTKTYYMRTFGHNTQEAIPMVAYYRNSSSVTGKSRPTLDQLHEAKDEIESPTHESRPDPDPEAGIASGPAPLKFGWIKGVLV